MKKISLIMIFLFASSVATASEKMTGKTKAWLTSQPGVSAIGCDSFEDRSYSISKREGFYIKESSFKKPKLFSDSKLTCDLWSDIADSEKLTLYIIEESKVDGVRVSLFQSDGSGTVGKDYNDKSAWQFGCKTDAMTDEYNCHISHNHFYVVKDGAGYHVVVGSEHFPKTRSLIRIDDEKPIESGEDGIFSPEQSEKIVEALSSSKKLRIRYTKWPRETPVDEVIDMKYFDTSKKVLNTIFDNHK